MFGLVYSPFWFAFGLLDLAGKSPEIRMVGAVLQSNGRSIMMTAIFGTLVVYIFSVFAYMYLAKYFYYMEDSTDNPIPACVSLFGCFVTVFNMGLRANDIGGNIEPVHSPDIKHDTTEEVVLFYVQIAFAIAFWFIVCIILLNVIFGIIIDSFGERRVHREMIKGKIDNECFICGVDRFTLDTQGGGFEAHRKNDHEKWNYLFMLVMLREKDTQEYNGWEQHVAQHMSPASSLFMPCNNALSLKEHKEREEAEARKQAEVAERTMNTVEAIAGQLKTLQAWKDEMDKKFKRSQTTLTMQSSTSDFAGRRNTFTEDMPPASDSSPPSKKKGSFFGSFTTKRRSSSSDGGEQSPRGGSRAPGAVVAGDV